MDKNFPVSQEVKNSQFEKLQLDKSVKNTWKDVDTSVKYTRED